MLTLDSYRTQTDNNIYFVAKKKQDPLDDPNKSVEENMPLIGFVMSNRFQQFAQRSTSPKLQKLAYSVREAVLESSEYDIEEYKRAGEDALMKAVHNYTQVKGEFSTYACYCIASAFAGLYKQKLKDKSTLSIYETFGESSASLVNIIPSKEADPAENAILNEEKEQLEQIYNSLDKIDMPDRYREIFLLLHKESKTREEVGNIYNISQDRVGQILKSIIIKIKNFVRIENDPEARAIRNGNILEMYRNYIGIPLIAKRKHLSPSYVAQILRENGEEVDEQEINTNTRESKRVSKISKMLQKRMSVREIARQEKIGQDQVRQILKQNGISIKENKDKRNQEIFEMSEAHIDPEEIAKEYNLKTSYVKQIIGKMKRKNDAKNSSLDIIV